MNAANSARDRKKSNITKDENPEPKAKMNQGEYGAYRKAQGWIGGTRQAVSKAINEGRIPVDENGMIDRLEADKKWPGSKIKAPAKVRDGDKEISLNEAKARKELFAAKNAELEYNRKRNELVEISIVEKSFFEMARQTRDKILQLPEKLGPILAGVTNPHEVENILKKHLNDALTGISDGIEYRKGKIRTSKQEAS